MFSLSTGYHASRAFLNPCLIVCELQASHLSECGYNHGALLVAGLFLSEEDTYISSCAVEYLSKFTEHSPWHKKAVMHYTELLENSDQQIRVGACLALGELKVTYTNRCFYMNRPHYFFIKCPWKVSNYVRALPGENITCLERYKPAIDVKCANLSEPIHETTHTTGIKPFRCCMGPCHNRLG